jgi:hypothetical protein
MGTFARQFARYCPALTEVMPIEPCASISLQYLSTNPRYATKEKVRVGGKARLNFVNIDDINVTEMQYCCCRDRLAI